jgi:hypothetical protein
VTGVTPFVGGAAVSDSIGEERPPADAAPGKTQFASPEFERLKECLRRQSYVTSALGTLQAKSNLSFEDIRHAVAKMVKAQVADCSEAEHYLRSFPSNLDSNHLCRWVEFHRSVAERQLLMVAEAIAAYGAKTRGETIDPASLTSGELGDSLLVLSQTTLLTLPGTSTRAH